MVTGTADPILKNLGAREQICAHDAKRAEICWIKGRGLSSAWTQHAVNLLVEVLRG